jgi:hypothetical protein
MGKSHKLVLRKVSPTIQADKKSKKTHGKITFLVELEKIRHLGQTFFYKKKQFQCKIH